MAETAWITTYTGRRVLLFHPDPEVVDIEDIAHALGNICRFVGHSRMFLSVAEHSIQVSRELHGDPDDELWGLFHDAAEAYLGDISKPLKRALPTMQMLEGQWLQAIAERFNLPPYPPEALRKADEAVLVKEWLSLLPEPERIKEVVKEPPSETPVFCWGPLEASHRFLERFREIQRRRK